MSFIIVIALAVLLISRTKPGAPAPAELAPDKSANTVYYSCNDSKNITAIYHTGETKPAPSPDQPPIPGGSVDLKLSDGRSMTLAQTISADGVRYSDGDPAKKQGEQGAETFVFWSKGNGALVLENNEEKSYIGCVMVAPQPTGSDLSQVYSNGPDGFSLRYPAGYTVDESYQYQELGPNDYIAGVKFTIPDSASSGTNLGSDSYISVEQLPKTPDGCTAADFVYPGTEVKTVSDADTEYSYAFSNGAGAGNRYDETVYALPGTNPCTAVRYFIHYSVFENYPPGAVKEFDEQALVKEFDSIRRTLIINQ